MAMSLTNRIAKNVLDRETDARFWGQTGYKIGQKLDPHIPADKAMAKVWLDIFNKVKRENDQGRLVLTYNKPGVERHLNEAANAQAAAIDNLHAAASADDPAVAQVHTVAAQQAANAATVNAQTAAAQQPPTVSPELAHLAGTEAALAHDAPLPGEIPLDDKHPAIASPAAQPSMPLASFVSLFDHNSASPSGDAAQAASAALADHEAEHARMTDIETQLAVAQATQSPRHAVGVHEVANNPALPPARGSIPPATIAQIRDHARAEATEASHPPAAQSFVGMALNPNGGWVAEFFATRDELDTWYGQITDHPESFQYAAAFDFTQAPEAINELFGSGQAIPVSVAVDQTPAPAPTSDPVPPQIVTKMIEKPAPVGAIAAVGAAGVFGLLTAFAGRGKKKGRRY